MAPKKSEQLPPDPATVLERSRAVFLDLWKELLRLRRAVIKSSALDDIHDLRVASRRVRAVLELFNPFVPKGPASELRKSVRKLTRLLGGLRNIDEALLFFRSHTNMDASADSELGRKLSTLRAREFKRINKALVAFDHRMLGRMARKIVGGLNEDCVKERNRSDILAYFLEVSIRLYLPIQPLSEVSTAPGHRASRHALRIAIKKWRYFYEIIAQVLNRDYSQVLELQKEYQSILGRMNDICEFEGLINNFGLSPEVRELLEEILLKEDALLLEEFKNLIGQKPLSSKFLVKKIV